MTILPSGEDMEVISGKLVTLKTDDWIPVGERLPEDRSLVLAVVKRGGKSRVMQLYFEHHKRHPLDVEGNMPLPLHWWREFVCYPVICDISRPYIMDEVTHWMKMPTPPEEVA
jgi:hypothetical protein